MATKKKALQAAAGAAGGAEATYVDDVFSTYLYESTGWSQTITNGIQLGDGDTDAEAFTAPGTYSWVCPQGVTSVNVVCVGAGGTSMSGGSGGGGELRYKNNISVTPGNTYTVVVGAANSTAGAYAGSSSFNSTTCVANGGQNATSGSQGGVGGSGGTGDGGGNGGNGAAAAASYGSGGGAGGYAGAGGDGSGTGSPTLGTGGAGAGGISNSPDYKSGGGGGGVGIFGQGSNASTAGEGGSGGEDGGNSTAAGSNGTGGNFGGGGGSFAAGGANGGNGAVRIVYRSSSSFPSTNVGFTADGNGKGGMVWVKSRSNAGNHHILDTERGVSRDLIPSDTGSETYTSGHYIRSFNSDGFAGDSYLATYGNDVASWTFRKAPGFFDVVTFVGDGTGDRAISHNLGCDVGMLIVKKTTNISNWFVYHKGDGTGNPLRYRLNDTDAGSYTEYQTAFHSSGTRPTSTEFYVGGNFPEANASGETYVAYLFADGDDADAQIFGTDNDQAIISCGSFTTDGSYNSSTTLGWEPQWVMAKRTDSTSGWFMWDMMRGMPTDGDSNWVYANTSDAEVASSVAARPNATGFTTFNLAASGTYIYIAIRRPHKPAESGTDVFAVDSSPNSNDPRFISGFPVDMALSRKRTSTGVEGMDITSRLTTGKYMRTGSTNAEASSSTIPMDYMNGFDDDGDTATDFIAHMFKRSPGFFDVVCYEGTGSSGNVIDHNLGITPEIIILKRRDTTSNWTVWHSTFTGSEYVQLNKSNALMDDAPTVTFNNVGSSSFQIDSTFIGTNVSGGAYIACLFASQDGISKVFSVTKSSGSNADVNCGFSSGARFVMLKRTDSTGDWYVWDTERGIVAGNDPYLLLNSTAAENTSTDYIDPLSTGFTIVDGGLANGDYIGIAIS